MWQSSSTAQRRKLPDGWPPPTRLLTCRGTRSTLGPSMPRRGCPSTAPSTGYARSTATNPGTTNCGPKPSITGALPCTPTLCTIQGCSSDRAMEVLGQGIEPSTPPYDPARLRNRTRRSDREWTRVPALVSLGGVRRARGGPYCEPDTDNWRRSAPTTQSNSVRSSRPPLRPNAARGYFTSSTRRSRGRRPGVRRCSASPCNYVEHRGNRTGKRKLRSDESTLAQATIVALRAP